MILYNQKPLLGKLPLWTPNPMGIPAPVGAWGMNEGSGRPYDSSLNGNNGINHGADWAPGGLNFISANTDYVDCGNKSVLDITGEITIDAYVKPTTGANITIISKGYNSEGYDADFTYMLYILDSRNFALIFNKPQATWQRFITTNTPIVDKTWQHISVVYNPATSIYALYLNGVSQPVNWDIGTPGTVPCSNSSPAEIGRRNQPLSYRYFDGLIGDVKVYNAVLTPTQIAYLHQHPYYAWEYPELWEYYVAATGWTGKVNGVTNPAKINGVAVANISKVMGIS